MNRTLGTLSTEEFKQFVQQDIDRRLEVWLTQLTDALLDLEDDEKVEFQPEFAASLRRFLEQARAGQGVDMKTF